MLSRIDDDAKPRRPRQHQPTQVILDQSLLLRTPYPALKLARRDECQLYLRLFSPHLVTSPLVPPECGIDARLTGVFHRRPVFESLTAAAVHFRELRVTFVARQRGITVLAPAGNQRVEGVNIVFLARGAATIAGR